MEFLPPAQPRVLPELPSEAELLSACHCLEVSDAQIMALLNKMLALFKEVQNVFTSYKPVCDLTTVPVIYRVFNSDDYKKQEAQTALSGLEPNASKLN